MSKSAEDYDRWLTPSKWPLSGEYDWSEPADWSEYIHVFNDGGRSNYFKGKTGDCVTRAISIASDQDYKKVYDDIKSLSKEYAQKRNNKASRRIKQLGNRCVRQGTSKAVYHPYLLEQDWIWIPTNHIGQEDKVYLRPSELPEGKLIVQIRKYLTVVENGLLYDTYDCSDRPTTPMVYGYYMRPQNGGQA